MNRTQLRPPVVLNREINLGIINKPSGDGPVHARVPIHAHL